MQRCATVKGMSEEKRQPKAFTPVTAACLATGIASYYLPSDLMQPGPRRVGVKIVGSTLLMVGYLVSIRPRIEIPSSYRRMPLARRCVAAATGAATVSLLVYPIAKLDRAVIKWVGARGLPYPNTVWAVLTFAGALADVAQDDNWTFVGWPHNDRAGNHAGNQQHSV